MDFDDGDAAVHGLMSTGGAAVSPVSAAFPGVEAGGAIDRKKLGARVFGNADQLRYLEGILHPMVADHKRQFIKGASRRRVSLIVLDVPLLFETGGDAACDAVVTVSAPRASKAASQTGSIVPKTAVCRPLTWLSPRRRKASSGHSRCGRSPSLPDPFCCCRCRPTRRARTRART